MFPPASRRERPPASRRERPPASRREHPTASRIPLLAGGNIPLLAGGHIFRSSPASRGDNSEPSNASKAVVIILTVCWYWNWKQCSLLLANELVALAPTDS